MSDQQVLDEIAKAMNAHGNWKLQLRTAIITGESEVSPDTARNDDKCAFGQWLHSTAIAPETRANAHFQNVLQKHAEFHQHAGAVLRKALDNHVDEANALLSSDFSKCSHELMVELTKWKQDLTQQDVA